MSKPVAPEDRARLIKLAGLFSSDHDGECVNAARMFWAFLQSRGLMPEDVLAEPPARTQVQIVQAPPLPPRTWRVVAEEVWTSCYHGLNSREREFLHDILTRGWAATERQVAWLAGIAGKRGIALWEIAP